MSNEAVISVFSFDTTFQVKQRKIYGQQLVLYSQTLQIPGRCNEKLTSIGEGQKFRQWLCSTIKTIVNL